MDNNDLTNKGLEQVSGGDGFGDNERYCKYCRKYTIQYYNGIGEGYDTAGNPHQCNLWVCIPCQCTNYWDVNTGELI